MIRERSKRYWEIGKCRPGFRGAVESPGAVAMSRRNPEIPRLQFAGQFAFRRICFTNVSQLTLPGQLTKNICGVVGGG